MGTIGKTTLYVDGKRIGQCREVVIELGGDKVNEPMEMPKEIALKYQSVECGPGYWQIVGEFSWLGPMIGEGI